MLLFSFLYFIYYYGYRENQPDFFSNNIWKYILSFISGIIFRPHASYILNLVLAYIFIDINNKDFHVLDSKNIPHNYNKIKS